MMQDRERLLRVRAFRIVSGFFVIGLIVGFVFGRSRKEKGKWK